MNSINEVGPTAVSSWSLQIEMQHFHHHCIKCKESVSKQTSSQFMSNHRSFNFFQHFLNKVQEKQGRLIAMQKGLELFERETDDGIKTITHRKYFFMNNVKHSVPV